MAVFSGTDACWRHPAVGQHPERQKSTIAIWSSRPAAGIKCIVAKLPFRCSGWGKYGMIRHGAVQQVQRGAHRVDCQADLHSCSVNPDMRREVGWVCQICETCSRIQQMCQADHVDLQSKPRSEEALEAYAIFEGGGAKGLAHVGALAASEQRQINFRGVAGASAGAIVAALVAADYKSIDMFDPAKPDDASKIYSADLRKLLKAKRDWSDYEKRLREVASTIDEGQLTLWKGLWLLCKHYRLVRELKSERGFFSTQHIEDYLDELLETKLLQLTPELASQEPFNTERHAGAPRVRFEHLRRPLKIVATDISNRKLIVFSREETPLYPVARAVGASICLPGVFKPHKLTLPGASSEVHAVDGGLLSNFPAWIFDTERKQDGPHIPTFGFRLVQQVDSSSAVAPGLVGFGKDLLATVFNGDPLLETREIENLHEIPLSVTVGTLDFDLDSDAKKGLFAEGFTSAERHFDRPGFPREPAAAKQALGEIVSRFRDALGLGMQPLIRANIVCMTTRGTLRVTYSCHMDTDDDADDRLEFSVGSGACSECWKTKAPVICDLVEAKADFSSTWMMDKYQQALVRHDLSSLVCYPIFGSDGNVQGILNLDSPDKQMLVHFMDEQIHELLIESTKRLSKLLQPVSVTEGKVNG